MGGAKEAVEIATRNYEQYMKLSGKLSERRSDLANTKKRREEHEKEFADLLVKRKRLEEIADKETRYFQSRERKEQLDALREQYQRKQELVRREEETALELWKREEKIRGLKRQSTEFEGIEEQLESAKRGIEAVQKQKERLHTELGAFKSQVVQAKKDIEERTRKKERIEVLGPEGECPLCERELGTHYEGILAKLSEELQAKRETLSVVFTDYKRKKEELASAGREEELLLQKDKELDRRAKAKQALETRIAHEERELAQWQAKLGQIKNDLKPLTGVE